MIVNSLGNRPFSQFERIFYMRYSQQLWTQAGGKLFVIKPRVHFRSSGVFNPAKSLKSCRGGITKKNAGQRMPVGVINVYFY